MRSKENSGTPTGVRRTGVVLAAIYLLDAWGQGVLSLLVSFVGLCVLGVGALVALVRGRRAWAASRARRALIYILLAVATVATTQFHARTVEARTSEIIEACEAYHAKYES